MMKGKEKRRSCWPKQKQKEADVAERKEAAINRDVVPVAAREEQAAPAVNRKIEK
jgi:hypothetical protein